MRSSKIDVPVALIFFNRPEQFAKVFEVVREAAPSKLFLIQDGPRENHAGDVENIAKCREVLTGIDWECEVHEDFSDENLGCGRRVYSGVTKCFETVDRLVILEDDCLPSLSFFPFCAELLEKYRDDDRVGLITGMNHLNTYDIASDYLFSEVGSIAGWATWRRSWEMVQFDLSDITTDPDAIRMLKMYQKYAHTRNSVYTDVLVKKDILDHGGKLSSWSLQFGIKQVLQSKLIIAPRVNLMTNIGLTAESANSVSDIRFVPRGLRPLYQLRLFELDFPLKHPKYVFNDIEYTHRVDALMRPSKVIRKWRSIESLFLRLIHGDKALYRKIRKKLFHR